MDPRHPEHEEQWDGQGAFQSPVKATGHRERLDVIPQVGTYCGVDLDGASGLQAALSSMMKAYTASRHSATHARRGSHCSTRLST